MSVIAGRPAENDIAASGRALRDVRRRESSYRDRCNLRMPIVASLLGLAAASEVFLPVDSCKMNKQIVGGLVAEITVNIHRGAAVREIGAG
jgi:hypothetical protein